MSFSSGISVAHATRDLLRFGIKKNQKKKLGKKIWCRLLCAMAERIFLRFGKLKLLPGDFCVRFGQKIGAGPTFCSFLFGGFLRAL